MMIIRLLFALLLIPAVCPAFGAETESDSSLVRQAEQAFEAERPAKAAEIYEQILNDETSDEPERIAAWRGLFRAAENTEAAIQRLDRLFKEAPPAVQRRAITVFREIRPDDRVLTLALIDAVGETPYETGMALLPLVADRPYPGLGSDLENRIHNIPEAQHPALIDVLGSIGNVEAFDFLFDLAKADHPLAGRAQGALERMPDEDVLLRLVIKANRDVLAPEDRVLALEIIVNRGEIEFKDDLYEFFLDEDEAVRHFAMRSLRGWGNAKDLPRLVSMLQDADLSPASRNILARTYYAIAANRVDLEAIDLRPDLEQAVEQASGPRRNLLRDLANRVRLLYEDA